MKKAPSPNVCVTRHSSKPHLAAHAARSRLQQLRSKLDKRTIPLADAWTTWCQSVERLTAAGKVDEKAAKEHNATVARINAEETKLRANADFREDLMK